MATEETPWWEEGDEAEVIEKAKEEMDQPRLWRFYLPAEKSNEITFITDLPFIYHEHNMQIDGSWKHWFTCKKKNCSLCRSGNSNYRAYAYLVIDHSEWTDKDGNEHKDELRLFVCKTRVASRLMKIREKKGTMRGVRVEAYRSEKRASNVGDTFTVEEVYSGKDLQRLKWWSKDIAALDEMLNGGDRRREWAKLLPVKSDDELANVVSKVADEPDEDEDRPLRF